MHDAPHTAPQLDVRGFGPEEPVRPSRSGSILCRIGSGNPCLATIASIQNSLRQERFAAKFAFVASTSFHLTILSSANGDRSRTDVSCTDAFEAPTPHFIEKLNGCRAPAGFRMKPTRMALDPAFGSVIRLAPSDHAQVGRLRLFQERLATLFQVPLPLLPPQIVLSHLIRPLDAVEELSLSKAHASLTAHLSRALSVLEVGPPEYCTFHNALDIHHGFFLDTSAMHAGDRVRT